MTTLGRLWSCSRAQQAAVAQFRVNQVANASVRARSGAPNTREHGL